MSSSPRPDEPGSVRRRRGPGWLTLTFVTLALALTNLGGYRPLTAHEVLVAQTAREMLATGDWLLPTYYGEPRLRKPPLAYWEVMVCYLLTGGHSEWAARLPSALAGVGLVWVTTCLATGAYGRRVGLLAGFMQATSVYFIVQSRLAEADMTLALSVAVALSCWSRIGRRGRRLLRGSRAAGSLSAEVEGDISPDRASALGFWLACGLSALAKGPVGPMLIAATVVVDACVSRRFASLRRLSMAPGIGLFALISGAWPVAMMATHPDVSSLWVTETIGRFLRDPNDVVRHPFYYPWASMWLTLPWTPFWVYRLAARRHHAAPKPRPTRSIDRFLLCWFFVPMVLLSLSAGKQEHYLIPALIPCAIWSALGLRGLQRRWSDRAPGRWKSSLAIATRKYGLAIAASGVALVMAGEIWLAPRLHGRRRGAEWASEVTSRIPSDERFVVLGHSAQWLAFYVDRPAKRVDSLERFLSRQTGPRRWVLTTRANLPALRTYCDVSEMRLAPFDSRIASSKTPVLVRVDGPARWPPLADGRSSQGRERR